MRKVTGSGGANIGETAGFGTAGRNEFLKQYNLKIHALSPIHIGSGDKITKKEYIYLPWDGSVIIPDIEKLYGIVCRRGRRQQYMDYMLKNNRDELGNWIKSQGFQRKDYEQCQKYRMDAGDAFQSAGNNARPKEILCFIKDAYGLPYVPGSSIKGMLRTALLAWEITHGTKNFDRISRDIQRNSRERARRDQCLSRETSTLEETAFHTLNRNEKKVQDAVNCSLAGLIVSDSDPIGLDRLTLSQKIDYTLDGKEKRLPVLRETLMPETDIRFRITIDSSLCPYTIETILEALDEFQKTCYTYFYSRFKRGSRAEGTVWLGGGCGFLSKTVLYPMFGKGAVEVADGVFRNTLGKNYGEHKHMKDKGLGVAPHVCKCTRYQGKLYDMGMGRIEVI